MTRGVKSTWTGAKISWSSLAAAALGPAAVALAPAWAVGQEFGAAVAVSGAEILVGEPASEREPGVVYRYAGEDWHELGRLSAPSAAVRDGFGSALASGEDVLLVTASGAREGAGVVHLYEREADGWRHVHEVAPEGYVGVGAALAVGHRHLLVRAETREGAPALLTWSRSADGAWRETERIEGEGEQVWGEALAVAGDIALVGAPAAPGGGAVYVYHYGSEGVWHRMARLAAPPEAEAADYGAAVAIADGALLVGAPGTAEGTGAVFWYAGDKDAGWEPGGVLRPEESAGPAAFGAVVVAGGDDVWVGAPAMGRGQGRVYALQRDGAAWRLAGRLAVTADGRPQAGRVLALAGGVGVVGLPGDDFGAGAAWAAVAEDETWRLDARLASEQVGLPAIAGGQVDCAEGAADGFDCADVDLLAFIPREQLGAGRGARLNDVWGWTDPESGREYAIVGRMDGTAFVDVSDPHNPRYLGNLPKTEGSQSNTWRDMKVFADHAFIVADGAGRHGMQIFDLRQLRDVGDPRDFEETARYDGVASSHNIIINEETGFAYLVGVSGGGETCGGGLHMVDINEPLHPVFAGCFAHPNTGRRGTGGTHDAQCVVYRGPDPDYQGREICMNANETALSIADVTDKANPIPIAQAAYPNVAYAHQGWLTEDQRYFYSNDELDELGGLVDRTRTLVWDVSDLDDPTLVREYYSPTRVTDHNLYVRGDRLYMSNNRSGLRVVDIRDPENPVEIGFFDTTPWSEDSAGFDGTWSVYPYFESGTILLSSRREGLFLVRPRDRRLVP